MTGSATAPPTVRSRAPLAWSAKSGPCSFYVRPSTGFADSTISTPRWGAHANLLAARLKTLVTHGLLERVAYQDDVRRSRHEYRLTDKGRDLFPVVVALMQWGDRWTADDSGPAVQLLHRDCGGPVAVELNCGAGHVALGARDITPVPGPGAIAVV